MLLDQLDQDIQSFFRRERSVVFAIGLVRLLKRVEPFDAGADLGLFHASLVVLDLIQSDCVRSDGFSENGGSSLGFSLRVAASEGEAEALCGFLFGEASGDEHVRRFDATAAACGSAGSGDAEAIEVD